TEIKMQQQSVNTFTKLNADSAVINTEPKVLTDAVNATLTTRGENQLILQNINSTKKIAHISEGFRPLAVKVRKNIAYIISAKFEDGKFIEGEIGTYPSPDWNRFYNENLGSEDFIPLKQEYSPLKNFLPGNPSKEDLRNDKK